MLYYTKNINTRKEKYMIYLDNGATTRPFIFEPKKDVWLNSHSSYSNGDYLLWECRERIAKCINCEPSEIYFTSGGCEGNTWCINMLYEMLGRPVLVSPNEHKSIMNNPRIEIGNGKRFFIMGNTYDYDSCMLINNETGVRYDCDSIHKDLVQALGKVKVDVKELGCKMATFSGHKVHGDKGVGFVWISEGMKVKALIYGGGQERGVRGGTVDVKIFIYFVYLYIIFIHLLCISI